MTNLSQMYFSRLSAFQRLNQEILIANSQSLLEALPLELLLHLFEYLCHKPKALTALACTSKKILQCLMQPALSTKRDIYYPYLQVIHENSLVKKLLHHLRANNIPETEFFKEFHLQLKSSRLTNATLKIHEEQWMEAIDFYAKRSKIRQKLNELSAEESQQIINIFTKYLTLSLFFFAVNTLLYFCELSDKKYSLILYPFCFFPLICSLLDTCLKIEPAMDVKKQPYKIEKASLKENNPIPALREEIANLALNPI